MHRHVHITHAHAHKCTHTYPFVFNFKNPLKTVLKNSNLGQVLQKPAGVAVTTRFKKNTICRLAQDLKSLPAVSGKNSEHLLACSTTFTFYLENHSTRNAAMAYYPQPILISNASQ